MLFFYYYHIKLRRLLKCMTESLFNSLSQQKISERKIEESMLEASCTELFLSGSLNLL
jgi:hypothetical protein